MFRSAVIQLALAATLVSSHILTTYPGTRGNSFITNETYPFGMQWTYPCGGLTLTKNRTYWPTSGGTVAFQPGWFQGHASAFLYINLGLDTDGPDGGPNNFSTQLVKPWQLLGPSNGPYPGTLCMQNIQVPENLGVKPGDKATIQIVEIAAHGASLFSCTDIIFAEPGDKKLPPLNDTICFNTTEFGFGDLHTIVTKEAVNLESDASDIFRHLRRRDSYSVFRWAGWLPAVAGGLWLFL